jgi:hypothetical protein
MREALAAAVLDEAGVPAAKTVHVRVNLNGGIATRGLHSSTSRHDVMMTVPWGICLFSLTNTA